MRFPYVNRLPLILLGLIFTLVSHAQQPVGEWEFQSPREEIAPHSKLVTDNATTYLIMEGARNGHDNGSWTRLFNLEAVSFLQFEVPFRYEKVDEPYRSILATLTWKDENMKQIGPKEFPGRDRNKAGEWCMIQQTYAIPEGARYVEVHLIYRWDGDGSVEFKSPQLQGVDQLPSRKVNLATVHHKPRQSTIDQNRKIFADLAREAGTKGADIVCLPEGLTKVGTSNSYAQCAEPVPGPTTEILGEVARESNMYIVAGLLEKEGDYVYNTAVLLDREGKLVGKYRKVSLPREEIEGGVSPGDDFPVFDTDFGKIGIMICWDVSFPEPARQLAFQGAEIILLPIWGGNFTLAQARAIENQVYVVSSCYDPDMRSGIFDLEGKLIAEGTDQSPVVVQEVDLNQQVLWPWLGEFKNRIRQEMPARESIQF